MRFVAAGAVSLVLLMTTEVAAVGQTSTTTPPTLPSSSTTTLPPSTTSTVAPTTTAPQTKLLPATPATTTPEAPAHTVPPLPASPTAPPPLPIPADLAELQQQLDAQARAGAIAAARLSALSAEKTLEQATAANEVALAQSTNAVAAWAQAAEARRAASQGVARWATSIYVGSGRPAGPAPLLDPDAMTERQLRRIYGTMQIQDSLAGVAEADRRLEEADVARVRAADNARLANEALNDSRKVRDEAVARADALANGALPPGMGPSGPTILGQSVLTSTELAGWFRYSYPTAGTAASVPIEDITRHYIEEGASEGVRGDIAFAQAVLETGAWTSGHARNNNPAGIGAYDHCSPDCGFGFPSAELGIRAQIQLLRTYATPGLKTADLAHPPDTRLTPEGSGVRGCCPTWAQLTGVWATDPGYAPSLLNIFHRMLLWAIAARTV